MEKITNYRISSVFRKIHKESYSQWEYSSQNYLGPFYQNFIFQIRDEVDDFYIWISVDETTDINGRFIANIIINILHREIATLSYFISCKELNKTNHSTVTCFFNDSLKILWPNGGNDNKVLLMLSNAVPYINQVMF
jgi:hypothetical protein